MQHRQSIKGQAEFIRDVCMCSERVPWSRVAGSDGTDESLPSHVSLSLACSSIKTPPARRPKMQRNNFRERINPGQHLATGLT